MIHRRLSALLPHHQREFGFTPSRSTSDVVTLVIGKITRGLNEFSTVEYERPGGGAPTRHPRRHRSLVTLIDFSTVVDTTDHGKLFGMPDRLPRLGHRTKHWLHNYLQGRRVRVCTREQHSRKQLASAGAPQGSDPGPQLFLHCVDDLLRRLDNIYSAAALMHADELTLVASGAGIHACAAAMQPALSLITTWAAEHSLKINVDKSEAALFHISSHTRSDKDMVYLLPGNGNLHIQSRPVRLLDPTVEQILNFGTHASTAAKRTMPRRYQLRPVAQTAASHHTMQSFSIGYVHGVSLYCGESILPCLAYTYFHNMEVLYRDSCTTSLGISAPTEDKSVYLEANLLRLRKILWLRAITQHKRHARFHNHEDLRSLICSELMPLSMHRKAATSIPLSKDAVINGLERVCGTIGIPHNHNHDPPITQHRIIPRDTVSCNKVEFNQPLFANDASDDGKRTDFDSLYSSLEYYIFELWTDGSSSLAELASGSAAPLYGPKKKNDLPVEVHRAAAGRIACSYRAECLPLKIALDISYLVVWKHPNRPHESWLLQSPFRQLRHSALPHWPCENALLKRFGLCCFPW
ncbi:hypothetical protein C3747_75g41 [Trypanosoma cruzi]|uniref:Reverse transcriptase domain-containing protein n=1 Tax=Trypanosoma cruzi TaxID=5693 RepID=A0A2V2WNB3_TRYCR|nr:hypothetical protein C3747_75g41 [Trypanosoma cruzi]RNC53541.1 hypothetical protein TcCL_ESM09118 [Trypanosoma cruzi]